MLRQKAGFFDVTDAAIRRSAAEHLKTEEMYLDAAHMLKGVDYESTTLNYSQVDQFAFYVDIAELFLQDSESVDAETYVNKAQRV